MNVFIVTLLSIYTEIINNFLCDHFVVLSCLLFYVLQIIYFPLFSFAQCNFISIFFHSSLLVENNIDIFWNINYIIFSNIRGSTKFIYQEFPGSSSAPSINAPNTESFLWKGLPLQV